MESSLPTLEKSHWHKVLFEDPVGPAMRERTLYTLRKQAKEFLAEFPASMTSTEVRSLNEWYSSTEGQALLVQVAQEVTSSLFERCSRYLPVADRRTSLVKVPASTLEWSLAEKAEPWERVAVLAGALHAYGQWPEARIFGEHCESGASAYMGLALARELLSNYPLPFSIRQHILLATLRHAAGNGTSSPMPLKLVMSAHREHLCAPERALQLVTRHPSGAGSLAMLESDLPGRSVLSSLELIFRTCPTAPLKSRQSHVANLRSELCSFMMTCESAPRSQLRFASSMPDEDIVDRHQQTAKHPFDWQFEYDFAQWAAPERSASLEEAMREFVDAPAVVDKNTALSNAMAKVEGLDVYQQRRWAKALLLGKELREQEDHRQRCALRQALHKHRADRFVCEFADILLHELNT